jgi:integrase
LRGHATILREVDELFVKRAAQAKVADVHLHDLQRTFISDLLDKGVDIATAAKLAVHANPQTALRYDRRKMDTRRRAVAMLHVPYHRHEKLTQ